MTAAELAELVPLSDEDKGMLISSRMAHPAEVQRRILASAIRQEALLVEIRDALAGGTKAGRRSGS